MPASTTKWAIAPVPAKVSSTSFVGGSNLVVYKDSKNKDLAWKFVEYLSDPATQVAWYTDVTDLPAVPGSLGRRHAQGRRQRSEVRRAAQEHEGPASHLDLERDRDRPQWDAREDDDRLLGLRKLQPTRCSRQPRRSEPAADMTVPALAQRQPRAKAEATRVVASGPTWREDLTGWAFAAPFMIVFGLFLAFPIVASFALSFTSFGLARSRQPDRGNVRRPRELHRPVQRREVLDGVVQHVLLRRHRRADHPGHRTPHRQRAQSRRDPLPDRIPRRLLPAGHHQHRRHRRRLAVPAQSGRRARQHVPGRARDQRPGVARGPGPGDAIDHRDGGLAEPRIRDDRVPCRHAGHPQGALRGGSARWRQPSTGVPVRDHPHAPTDDPVHDGHHDDRLPAAVRGAVRDDRRRAAGQDPVGDACTCTSRASRSSTRATPRRSRTSCSSSSRSSRSSSSASSGRTHDDAVPPLRPDATAPARTAAGSRRPSGATSS